ncbi:MAG: lipoprotein signal peptidase [Sphingobacteriales bacterium]|nr:lipoprotein signal peptidase [Sphingobacteriales bacterium]MBP9140107.1 lipoprotein signal peptidase [Chitinophagales bacterium]MDA0198221.1 lipoprotein signal peptidase [Bacteroidota bacterium]MBK6889968.1 lipoprotein signal peptidase [Sphingobacteriales bacterium]MBK7527508.1 lipoprotein signal peptidase [Sphingobacteriales bacterium]
MRFSKATLALIIIIGVLLIDQISKFYIKTTMSIGDEIVVFDWFRIHFVENEGMAFGLSFGGEYGKLALTLFRMIAVAGLGYFIVQLCRKPETTRGLVICMALILAGALGNIIDSIFYGVIFNHSYHQIASFLPPQGGYGTLLHGRVVDMLYFPLINWQGTLPTWIPVWGGTFSSIEFFQPVFNIADTAISTGVFAIILFQRKILLHGLEAKPTANNNNNNNSTTASVTSTGTDNL